jgi:SAM-dependent methyltransferase
MSERWLARSRRQMLDRHPDAEDWRNRLFSAGMLALYRITRTLLSTNCRGRVLDAGAGRQPWRRTIEGLAERYESLDRVAPGGWRPTHEADLAHLAVLAEGQFDTVVCTQVLEHVADPGAALAEMRRVLRPGGTLIVTVPHLSRRHELPHDYFRYTQEGLRALLARAGLEIVEVGAYGGLLSFLHHQTSFVFPGLVASLPLAGSLAALLNAPVAVALEALDRLIDRQVLLPLGVFSVARRPTG